MRWGVAVLLCLLSLNISFFVFAEEDETSSSVCDIILEFKDFQLNLAYFYEYSLKETLLLLPESREDSFNPTASIASLGVKEKKEQIKSVIYKNMSEDDIVAILGEPHAVSEKISKYGKNIHAWIYMYPATKSIPVMKQVIIFKNSKIVQAAESILDNETHEFRVWMLNESPSWNFIPHWSIKKEPEALKKEIGSTLKYLFE